MRGSGIDGEREAPHRRTVAAVPGRPRRGFRPLPGALAVTRLPRSHSSGCGRVFSRHARVPRGAPCIFGSIQQAGVAVYAPEVSFWASEIIRQTIWVGRRRTTWRWRAFRAEPCPKATPAARCSRFAASPAGVAMLNTPVFARSKRGYVWTGRGAPVYLCMAQAKICKTIGRHAPDAQIGRAIRRRSPRSFRAVRESKVEGSYGRAGGPADGGVAAELALAVGKRALGAAARRPHAVACHTRFR